MKPCDPIPLAAMAEEPQEPRELCETSAPPRLRVEIKFPGGKFLARSPRSPPSLFLSNLQTFEPFNLSTFLTQRRRDAKKRRDGKQAGVPIWRGYGRQTTASAKLCASASLRWNQVPGTGFPRAKSAKSAKCINGNFAHFAHFARDGMKPRFMTEFLEKCANVKVLPTANANANAQLDNGNIGTGNIGNWQQFPKCITGNFAHFAHFARDFRSTQKRRMSLPRASPRRCAGTAFVLKLAPLKSAPPPVLICKSETPSGIRVLTHDFPAF